LKIVKEPAKKTNAKTAKPVNPSDFKSKEFVESAESSDEDSD
jgi:hypothetical protein